MTESTLRKTPTLAEFKTFCKDIAPAAKAVLMARVFAEMERERVNAYIRPIFDRYVFTVSRDFRKLNRDERITKPEDLYLSGPDDELRLYYADCDDAHLAHGFTGPKGHCPALTAEHLLSIAEGLLIDLAEPILGFKSEQMYGENRVKCLDLLIGAAIKEAR